jgi:sterol desaturase/sphingolipid hydroxylase (fatty acid hydroxylase superfamily)
LNYKKWHHASINIFLTLTTIVVNFALAFILQSADWAFSNQFEFCNGYRNVIMVICLSRFTFIDLIGAYLVHLVEHKIKFLWRFHLIHHTDVWVDTSANRHHPGESVDLLSQQWEY